MSTVVSTHRTARTGIAASILLSVLRGYQRWVSPLFGPHCRFYPSCSSYAVTAVSEYGALHGSWLALRRLSRCHPWHAGGVDYVPQRSCGVDSPSERSSTWAS